MRQGIKARRTRNEGRVRALSDARGAGARGANSRRRCACGSRQAGPSGQARLRSDASVWRYGEPRGRETFRSRIMRGDRIGLIGPNGAGKTTLLRLLLGELAPDRGHGQARHQPGGRLLRPAARAARPGADGLRHGGRRQRHVTVNGQTRTSSATSRISCSPPSARVAGQGAVGRRAQPAAARAAVHAAGQRAGARRADQRPRHRNARTARAQLVEWTGTLLLVSHDRTFLDNVVTSTLVFEGDGRVQEYRRRLRGLGAPAAATCRRAGRADRPAAGQERAEETLGPASSARPRRTARAHRGARGRAAGARGDDRDPGFYRQPAATITAALDRAQAIGHELGEL